jgi:hypothetical protein
LLGAAGPVYAGLVRIVGWRAQMAAGCAALASFAGSAQASENASPAESVPRAPACPACRRCCDVAVEAGPRAGISINGDQWVVGSHLRITLPCLGNLGVGPVMAFGLGSNYLTLRSSWRLDYLVWFDEAHTFGLYPAVGASALFYMPGGGFATFCNRVGLDECWGHEVGFEAGGGARYKWFAVDGFIGFDGLPAVTIMAAASFALTHPEAP